MNQTKPFCVVPFVEGFSGLDSDFRNCCSADPQISSVPGQSFTQWWQDSRLIEFKQHLTHQQWLPECRQCRIQEENFGHSFRTAVNDATTIDKNFGIWPSRWNLKFGNICNLACWTCNEYSSSVIAQHKRTIGILPEKFVDGDKTFQDLWSTLKLDVLKSYDYHQTVTITLLGGEPIYNKTVIEFLSELVDKGLSLRTRLEFHTNATKINHGLFLPNTWNYVCVFLSLDAVGRKAEWLRYGCDWNKIVDNINFFKSVSNYVEVHCTLSVLNINDLPELSKFCKNLQLPLKIIALSSPKFMSLSAWSGNPAVIADAEILKENGFKNYYDLLGSAADSESAKKLHQYISQFDAVRKNLSEFDPKLYHAIKVSAC